MPQRPRKTPEQRLAEIAQQKANLSAKERRLKQLVGKQERAEAEHEKFIIGGTMLELAKGDDEFAAHLSQLLDKGVSNIKHREHLIKRGSLTISAPHVKTEFPQAAE